MLWQHMHTDKIWYRVHRKRNKKNKKKKKKNSMHCFNNKGHPKKIKFVSGSGSENDNAQCILLFLFHVFCFVLVFRTKQLCTMFYLLFLYNTWRKKKHKNNYHRYSFDVFLKKMNQKKLQIFDLQNKQETYFQIVQIFDSQNKEHTYFQIVNLLLAYFCSISFISIIFLLKPVKQAYKWPQKCNTHRLLEANLLHILA